MGDPWKREIEGEENRSLIFGGRLGAATFRDLGMEKKNGGNKYWGESLVLGIG